MDRAKVEGLFLLGLLLITGWVSFLIFKPLLEFVVVGFLLAFAFNPVYTRIRKRFHAAKAARGLAATSTIILVSLIILLPFLFVLSLLIRDVSSFVTTFHPETLETQFVDAAILVASALGLDNATADVRTQIGSLIRQATPDVAAALARVAGGLPALAVNAFLGTFVVLFTMFYGFTDGPRFLRGIRAVMPMHENEKDILFDELRQTTHAVFTGHLLIALIQAAIGTIGFLIFGVPRAFLWGFIMVIAAILPIVGPALVWAPVALYMLLSGNTWQGVALLLWGGVLVSTIDNVLRPKLIASRSDVHPFLVLIGVIGGITVFGFTGFVMGPLVLGLFMAAVRVHQQHWEGRMVGEQEVRSPMPEDE